MAKNYRRRKRIYPRVNAPFQLALQTQERLIYAKTADLGYGGALIGTGHTLPVGTDVTVELQSSSRRAATAARVVREYPDGIAVEFVRPSSYFIGMLVELLTPYLEADAWNELKGGQVIKVDFGARKRSSG